jgi:hypothetical protein
MFRFKLLMPDTAFASGVCLATCMGAALCRDSRFEGADTADAFCLSTTCSGSALLRDSTMPRLKVLARNRYRSGIVVSDTMAENVSRVSRFHEYIHTYIQESSLYRVSSDMKVENQPETVPEECIPA